MSEPRQKSAFWHFFTCMFVSTLPFSLGVFKDKEERQRWICVKMIIIIIHAHSIIFYFIYIFVITVCFSTCCFLFYRDLQSKQHRATFQLIPKSSSCSVKQLLQSLRLVFTRGWCVRWLTCVYSKVLLLHIYLNLMENQQNPGPLCDCGSGGWEAYL